MATAPPTVQRARRDRWLPLLVVAVACVFGLVAMHAEVRPAENLNDSALHLSMVRWAGAQIRSGRVPLDGWYPYFSLGTSEFHHYQSLPAIVTAYVWQLVGGAAQTTYLWFLYLLLALWPLSVYWGARLFGWGRWPSAAAALLSPLLVSTPGYGFEAGSYIWRGYGLYTQIWGMWLLPPAWGLTWRAVSTGRYYATAAAALALTIAVHFMTGYLAALTVGVWVVLAWHGLVRRAARAVVVGLGAALIAAWVLVPLIADRDWSTQSIFYKGTFYNNSYGARKVLGWLVTGRLFDAGRPPVVTVLAAVGLVVCLARARRDERARAVLGAGLLSLLLYFGRPTLGAIIDRIPGNGDLQIHRFVMGVDLAAILLAGVGLAALGGWLTRFASSRWGAVGATIAAVVIVAATVGGLAPAWTSRATFDLKDSAFITAQRAADRTDGADLNVLIDQARDAGDGRVYAGLRSNWGTRYTVGQVPVFAELANADADGVGFTFRTLTSLSADIEASFNEDDLAQYQMLNVKYLLLPSYRSPSVPAKLIGEQGQHRLYELQTSGYFQVVDLIGSVTANRATMDAASQAFMDSDLASHNEYPTVAFDGRPAAPPTTPDPVPPGGPPGAVLSLHNAEATGEFSGTVEATRSAAVVLKATYDPRWTVKVDGVRRPTIMVAPSLVGVDVPAGVHRIDFHYRSYPDYPLLIAIGVATLVGLGLLGRRGLLSAGSPPGPSAGPSGGPSAGPSGGQPQVPRPSGDDPAEQVDELVDAQSG